MKQNELNKILELHKLWFYDNTEGKRANLIGANLSDADLIGADLRDANLIGADLIGADLRDANLIGADLSGADLSDANLSGADLRGVNLIDADLSGANLRDADLSGADLRGANLDKRYIQISCIGSRKDMTTYCLDYDIVWCGCFHGTLKEFTEQVKETHKENKQYLDEYLGFIKYIKLLKKGSKND